VQGLSREANLLLTLHSLPNTVEWEASVRSNIEIPDDVAKALMQVAGVDQSDIEAGAYQIMAIELDALGLASTACGMIGNKPFSMETLSILKDNGVEFVVAVVDQELRICSMAAKMLTDIAELLENAVNANSGSLHQLTGNESAWVLFESE